MSIVTKLFSILTAIAGVIFLIIAGTYLAKKENFKVRLAAESTNRVQEELVQDRLLNRLAALQERKRKTIFKSREYILIQNAENTRVEEKADNAREAESSVTRVVERFSEIRKKFSSVIPDYTDMLKKLMGQVEDVAAKKDKITKERSALWSNLASIEAKVGHLRENINLLDYNLYRLRQNNKEKRQLLEVYREIDPSIAIPGFLGTNFPKGGEIISYDEEQEVVVINHGWNSFVEAHQIFTVTRNGEYIAQVEIFSVYKDQAAGRVLQRSKKQPIRIGDKVRPRAVFSGISAGK